MPDEIVDIDELVERLSGMLGPYERAPALFMPYHVKRDLLYRVFSGAELGDWDRSVLGWLAGADGDTVISIAGMVRRAIVDAEERCQDGRGG
jgi:hypothetical protein